ncbi:MAG: polymer-forming cytoskeletal protein [Zoogloeaceae bacterium]|jgi:cytoskeletal protein CcmA (bactofilin family)|nr:polymer-forming cytoskeletal protein [Zoogloeaceae bacterium]
MFGASKPAAAVNQKIVSLIDQGTRIEGNIRFNGGLRVDGEICGQVQAASSDAALILSEHGSIRGEVDVPHLSTNGSIHGPVRAASLHLQTKARIVGDVTYSRIMIELGAVIEGRMVLETPAVPERKPGKPRETESGKRSETGADAAQAA